VQAIWVERIEVDVRAAQQAALLVMALGGKPEWPSLEERLAAFYTELASTPVVMDRAELELREALGLRRPGG
jgi:hypothetical protein